MEARELRIGNLVLVEGKLTKVESLSESGINMYACSGYYPGDADLEYEAYFEKWIQTTKQIMPIQLTEEWLLKFGFDSIEDGWYKKGEEQFSWNVYDKALRFRGMWIAEPEYVHQLQNLYFALTGEELCLT